MRTRRRIAAPHLGRADTPKTPTPRSDAVVVRRTAQQITHRPFAMPVILRTAGLLVLSNLFMTFAWYAHLKNLSERPWYVAALVSWGIALF